MVKSMVRDNTHGNTLWQRKPVSNPPDVRKVDVGTVPAVFSADVVGNGRTVWAGFDGERVICVAATADEARRKWRLLMARKREGEERGRSGNLDT
jgi:hypothetical protein